MEPVDRSSTLCEMKRTIKGRRVIRSAEGNRTVTNLDALKVAVQRMRDAERKWQTT